MQPIIQVDHLVKRYRGSTTNAVDGVSFDVQPGEFFALLGPNGAGKTSTISILTTTLKATSGRVTMAGRDLEREASLVRREIGIIFQKPSLDQNLTAEENIRFHAVLYGLYPFRPWLGGMPRAYREDVARLARLLGIADAMDRPVRTFSGGMRRKLEIVRSLIHKPRVLFLDEPTTGLDPESRRNLWDYLMEVRSQRGTTIFLTTHYLEEAEQADQICVIDHGAIVASGSPAHLKAELTRPFLVLDADDRPALRQELARLGLAFTEQGGFRVELDGWRVQDLMRAIQTPLTVVQTHSPSLEDAYLKIVGAESE